MVQPLPKLVNTSMQGRMTSYLQMKAGPQCWLSCLDHIRLHISITGSENKGRNVKAMHECWEKTWSGKGAERLSDRWQYPHEYCLEAHLWCSCDHIPESLPLTAELCTGVGLSFFVYIGHHSWRFLASLHTSKSILVSLVSAHATSVREMDGIAYLQHTYFLGKPRGDG